MHRLLLLRHAKSSWDDPALSDHARPLNARGRRAAGAMAAAMRGLGLLRPDLVLVSSSRRTLQTLEALGPMDGARVEVTDDLYLAPWTRLLDSVRDAPEEAGTVLVLAHNPGLHELAMELAADGSSAGDLDSVRDAYPTCALAEFEVPGPWSALDRGSAKLTRFLAPRDLPEHAT